MLQSTVATQHLRALDRAECQGVRVKRVDGVWYASSVSHPGSWHVVNGRCDCEGAQRGLFCKHLAAVEAVKRGEWWQCQHCGEWSATVVNHSDYIGGRGYVTSRKCLDRVACWHRWDVAHGLAV